MGKKSNELIKGIKIEDLVEDLNKAYADEWLAYYQYWVGAKVVKGVLSERVKKELEEHATEELDHATKLALRIIELGYKPILSFEDLLKKSVCGFLAPEDSSEKKILEQNLKGERCAIHVYNELLKKTNDKDVITYRLIYEILNDEIEHENDLEAILEDLEQG